MDEITPFQFPATGQPVRTVLINGKPWFVLADVAKILGYRDAEHAGRLVRPGQLSTLPEGTWRDLGGRGSAPKIITEGGLYRLIMRSNAELAGPFQDWVTDDVLPQIRRTGSYSALPELPQTHAEALRALADEVEAHEQTRRHAAALEAPAQAWNVLADATGDYSVREAAQILDRDPAISTGQNRLFVSLREFGWLDRKGVPYQTQVDLGRIVQRPISYTHPHKGEPVLTSQVRITAKGVEALRRLLGGGDDGHLFALPDGA